MGGNIKATLVVTMPGGGSKRHPLLSEETVVGRSADCGVTIEDNSVSRRHALVVLEVDGVSVQDLGSANGVLLGGEKIESAVLADGDELTLGRVVVTLEVVSAQAPAAAGDATVVKAGPTPGAQVAASAGTSGSDAKRKKFFVLAGGILIGGLVLIVGVSIIMRSRKAPPPQQAMPAASQPASMEQAPAKTAQPTQPATAPQAASAPTAPTAPSAPAPGRAQTTPAAQGDAAEHIQKGEVYRENGRMLDALSEFEEALKLEPDNAKAQAKLEATRQTIDKQAETFLAHGLQNFKYLKYESAIQDWMRVIYLIPDENHPLHRKAAEYIEQARGKLSR